MNIEKIESDYNSDIYKILSDIKNELVYSRHVDRSPLWLNIEELIRNKKLPIKSSCTNLSLYISNKLYKNNINSKIILSKRWKIFHFLVEVNIWNNIIYIDENKWTLIIYNNLPENIKIIFTSKVNSWEKNIIEIFDNKMFKISLYIKDIVFNLLPRQWDIDINRKKDIKMEEIYNKLWKK